MDKKGLLGLNQLVSIILLLVIIGIMLTVGLRIQSGVSENMKEGDGSSNINESQTITTSGITLTMGSGLPNQALTTSSLVYTNATAVLGEGELLYDSANFTSTSDGTITASATIDEGINNTLVNISYDYTFTKGTAPYNASREAIEGTENVSEQQGLLGTIIIFGIILSVVVIAFQFKT